ncbi:hypothetical protein ACX0HA_09180 [Flavobacterium hauense]
MKKILLPLLSLLLLSLSGCNNDDDKKPTDPLLHQWTLISAEGGFAGSNYDFEEGLILWRFKANGTVQVINGNTDENKPDGFDSGTYDYEINDNTSQIQDCPKSMDIDTFTFYCYSIQQGQLILDDSPVDGIKYTFVRADLIP